MASNLTRAFLWGSRSVQTSFIRTLASKGPGGNNNQSGGYGGSGPDAQASINQGKGSADRSSPSSQSSGGSGGSSGNKSSPASQSSGGGSVKKVATKATEWVKETKQNLSSNNDHDSDKRKGDKDKHKNDSDKKKHDGDKNKKYN